MPETTTLEVMGAKITVPTSALFRAWLDQHIEPPARAALIIPAAKPNERYVGGIIEPSGRVCHTFLMPGEWEKDWNAGMALGKELGGDLPNRIEQAMLQNFMADEFQKKAYWSNTQHAGYSYYAWYQYFSHGYQGYGIKSAELGVRFVRRVFSDSVI